MGEKKDVPEGWKGNLTDEQTEKLKEIWKMMLKIKEEESPIEGVKADQSAKKGEDGGPEEGGEDAFKGKAKDDAAKDKQAQEEEKKALAGLLGSHGAKAFHEEFWRCCRGEDPDALMLRFLRARKWDVKRAFMMMAGACKWRLDFDVEEIKKKGEEGMCKEDGFRLQYDIGKSYTHGTDKEGRPVIYIHVARHNPKDQSQEALQRFVVFSMEASKAILTPESLGQGTLIFDMTNFGLKNMDWACVKFIVECFEKYYPETLGKCLVHKAPMVFNAIWAILKPLLDPVVRNKIDFTKNDNDLKKYIDPEHFPSFMGGAEQWEWSYEGPKDGENEKQESSEASEKDKLFNDASQEFEELTQKWVDGDKSAGDKRDKQAKVLTVRYLDSDPYVRGVTVMRRDGIMYGNGQVKWNYAGAGEETLGTDFNEVRKELGIEGECPRNEAAKDKASQLEDRANRIDPDHEAAVAAGKAKKPGEGTMPPLLRRASNSFSAVTPGASKSDKAREGAEREKAAVEKEAKEAREQQEAEQKKKEEEEQKQKEQEAAKSGGVLGALNGAVASAGSVASKAASGAAAYVPAAVGGDKLREYTGANGDAGAEENKEN